MTIVKQYIYPIRIKLISSQHSLLMPKCVIKYLLAESLTNNNVYSHVVL